MLWVDKYRPKTLEEVELYPELSETLSRLAKAKDLPHLLFYGPTGSGKKTRAMAVLHEVYGPSVYSMKLEHKSVPVTESKVVDIATLSSPHHIDMNPSDAGNYDRVIVMQMIREIAQTVPLLTGTNSNAFASVSTKRINSTGATNINGGNNNVWKNSGVRYKVVVLNEVDRMTRSAQHALRRTMEKYMNTCRLILICNSTSRLIAPLRSRCLGIRVPSHNTNNVRIAVSKICNGERRPLPSEQFINTLAMKSAGNLRRALLMFEAAVMTHVDVASNGAAIPLADWQVYIQEIAKDIMSEQTPKKLHEVRLKFYDLLGQCISGETILKNLVDALLSLLPVKWQMELIQLAAKYDHNMKLGTKPILHLEAFTAGVMKCIKDN